jgi:hypothetical protein
VGLAQIQCQKLGRPSSEGELVLEPWHPINVPYTTATAGCVQFVVAANLELASGGHYDPAKLNCMSCTDVLLSLHVILCLRRLGVWCLLLYAPRLNLWFDCVLVSSALFLTNPDFSFKFPLDEHVMEETPKQRSQT